MKKLALTSALHGSEGQTCLKSVSYLSGRNRLIISNRHQLKNKEIERVALVNYKQVHDLADVSKTTQGDVF